MFPSSSPIVSFFNQMSKIVDQTTKAVSKARTTIEDAFFETTTTITRLSTSEQEQDGPGVVQLAFQFVPKDVFKNIFDLVDVPSIENIALACKEWRQLVHTDLILQEVLILANWRQQHQQLAMTCNQLATDKDQMMFAYETSYPMLTTLMLTNFDPFKMKERHDCEQKICKVHTELKAVEIKMERGKAQVAQVCCSLIEKGEKCWVEKLFNELKSCDRANLIGSCKSNLIEKRNWISLIELCKILHQKETCYIALEVVEKYLVEKDFEGVLLFFPYLRGIEKIKWMLETIKSIIKWDCSQEKKEDYINQVLSCVVLPEQLEVQNCLLYHDSYSIQSLIAPTHDPHSSQPLIASAFDVRCLLLEHCFIQLAQKLAEKFPFLLRCTK